MNFFKYHGCGNDYVCIDCFNQNVDNPSSLSIKVSNRHFGIGSDGLILILPSNVADAKMRIFNSDGSEGNTCGNGLRCVCKYLFDELNIKKENILIETLSGTRNLKVIDSNFNESYIEVDMGKPIEVKNININIDNLNVKFGTYVSMGNPHFVVVCDDISNLDIKHFGEIIQKMDVFPDSVNVEFIKINSESNIDMRVFERGSGETMSCGSGACASVVSTIFNKTCKNKVKVNLLGGSLLIEQRNSNIYMTGNAVKTFSGTFYF